MIIPLQISFRDLRRNEELVSLIQHKSQKLDKFCDRIIQCHVTLSRPHRRHKTGNFFDVTIDISVPGKEIAISRESQNDMENKDVKHVLKEAFEAAYRQLEDYCRQHFEAA